ncbi:MAG: hypothetical protein IKC73_02745 [Clostridia bacterium]|nr:hypothetical protein [Clostridia bacterium]
MVSIYTDLYERYFSATAGRHYPDAQRHRIRDLIAKSLGVTEDDTALHTVERTLDTVEEQNIRSHIEAQNFLLVCNLVGDDPEVTAAAKTLVDVYEEMEFRTRQSGEIFSSHLEWVLSIRSDMAPSPEHRMDNALLEYSTGDLENAARELRILVNGGSFPAVAYLAAVTAEQGSTAEAYYYALLLVKTYEREVEIKPHRGLRLRAAALRAALTEEEAERIEKRVAKLPPFLTSDTTVAGIGFGEATTRRFTYEH